MLYLKVNVYLSSSNAFINEYKDNILTLSNF